MGHREHGPRPAIVEAKAPRVNPKFGAGSRTRSAGHRTPPRSDQGAPVLMPLAVTRVRTETDVRCREIEFALSYILMG